MEILIKPILNAERVLNFTIKVHKRKKSELHLSPEFYKKNAGGIPDFNYELEIIESSISNEEIITKKLHIHYENGEKYVCSPLALKTMSEVSSFIKKWGIAIGFHYKHFDPNWIENILEYGRLENPFEYSIEYLKSFGYSCAVIELENKKRKGVQLSILDKILIQNFDFNEEELKELDFFGVDINEFKPLGCPEEVLSKRFSDLRDIFFQRL